MCGVMGAAAGSRSHGHIEDATAPGGAGGKLRHRYLLSPAVKSSIQAAPPCPFFHIQGTLHLGGREGWPKSGTLPHWDIRAAQATWRQDPTPGGPWQRADHMPQSKTNLQANQITECEKLLEGKGQETAVHYPGNGRPLPSPTAIHIPRTKCHGRVLSFATSLAYFSTIPQF